MMRRIKRLRPTGKKRIPVATKSFGRRTSWNIIILVFGLALFGLTMIFNVSALSALSDFGDKFYYVKEQAQWFAVGTIVMIFLMHMNYRQLQLIAIPLLLSTFALLAAVFLPGIGIRAYGASRWVDLGFITVQPAELAKLTLIIYLAAWFSNKEEKRLTSFLVLLGLIIGPVILQPDLGTSVVLVTISLAMYFLSGAPFWHFGMLVPVVGAGIAGLAISAPYRMQRVLTFLNPSADPQGFSYHVRQIQIALGSGGLFGVGIGESRQKYAYLPEVTTDSIFAIIGEEFGFIGATIVMILFFVLVLSALRIAFTASDDFGKLLAGGIAFALSLQIIINLSAMVSLIPLTGIPLPFISYGGSNLVVSCAMIGILASIARLRKSTK
ncbi:MAG: stage V sporulation protein E, cell division protein FtsW [Microgenomates group bacterium GW2011_GWC1_41_8]|uniref:Probable peptidoglycan glycosyltransferase FtsW n=2 Tax=Candidatus Roizmaniibacteriota TaxID=1752723 RepID=A0A0G0T5I9_9BACT|nr:MAG: Stage V sporulation protein E [Candidatus Levybacteria bacterium GW2011_GWA2_40_16]KKR72259.1 MAG: Stage V sporulation protein E [Candidatus Roizmanbacteria bacterium GW2011_GWB1_40_7]KKR95056.1 MAG: Stage V sporulation protein E [Candidatus Roizmanbacteria bacterium GW2011_GWA1_41_13]KKS24811.1 MAG: stage V sporulation protein E, cell division protein FtsW [Microgenomates group bacterium GW2011_GWC1_41_8]